MTGDLDITPLILQRTEPGLDPGSTHDLDWHISQIRHITKGKTNAQLTTVIAYFAAQIHGLRTSANEDALLAIHQIRRIVRDYESRQP